jgi:arginase family enzyme
MLEMARGPGSLRLIDSDLVEVAAPLYDVSDVTAVLAANLV